jgi:hypothetical protein
MRNARNVNLRDYTRMFGSSAPKNEAQTEPAGVLLIVDAPGVGSGSVETPDRALAAIQHLGILVDLQATQCKGNSGGQS